MPKLIYPSYVAFFLLVISVGCAADVAIQSERELREECSFELGGMRECLEKKQTASEMTLKKSQTDVYQVLEKWDEDEKYIKIAQQNFSAGEGEFIAYREKYCQFSASLGGGAIGNALDIQRIACITELNNHHAKQLRDAIADLPLK